MSSQPTEAPPIDSGALIDATQWTLYQKLLTALVACSIVLDGFDIQVLAFSIPSLVTDWSLPRSAFAPVLAIGLVGMTIGGPAFGYIGDRWGRRLAMLGSVALFAAATLATAFIHSIEMLAVLRFLTGLGAGGAVPGASALSAEFAPLVRRPAAVKLTIVCVPLGGMLGGLLAARILPWLGWRALYLIGGALPLLLMILLWAVLPESPRFLAQHPRRWPELAKFLRRIGHSDIQANARFEAPAAGAAGNVSIGELFAGSGQVANTLGLWITFTFCLGGVYLIFGWLPTLLTASGWSVPEASSGLATYNLGGVCGVLTWAVLAALFGSRRPMLAGALGGAASAVAILFVPAGAAASRTLLIALIGVHGFLVNAIQTSLYALAAHIYPTRIRAFGVACASTMGRISGIFSSLSGSMLIAFGGTAFWGALALAMVLAFIGLAIVRNHIPAAKESR